jgi:hypothetical protein
MNDSPEFHLETIYVQDLESESNHSDDHSMNDSPEFHLETIDVQDLESELNHNE